MITLEQWFVKNRKTILAAVFAVFLIGLWAHGYGMSNLLLNHDSLHDFCLPSGHWQLSLGRVFEPVYRALTASYVLAPWSMGILCLCEITCAVVLLSLLLDLNSCIQIVLCSGIMVANRTITALFASYMPWSSADGFSLLMAVASAFCWDAFCKRKRVAAFVLAVVFLMISLGIYQAFLPTFIVVVLLTSIHHLLRGEKAAKVFRDGLIAIGILLLAGALYAIALKVGLATKNVELLQGEYNSLTNLTQNHEPIRSRVVNCLRQTIQFLTSKGILAYSKDTAKLANLILWLSCLLPFGSCLWSRRIGRAEKLLLVLLLAALIPMANGLRLLNGKVHDLMTYAIWLIYLVPFVFLNDIPLQHKGTEKGLRVISVAVLVIFIFGNIQTSNMLYAKKEAEGEATLSVITDVMGKIEDLDAYEEGVTPVYLLGSPGDVLEHVRGMERLETLQGSQGNSPITYPQTAQMYIRDFLLRKTLVIYGEDPRIEALDAQVLEEMPVYPAKGCIAMVGDVVVVKFK